MAAPDHPSTPRKTIMPWYDSEAVYLVMIISMFFVFIFGHIGLNIARTTPAYQDHFWIPLLLMVSSGIVILSITIRLVRRYLARRFSS